MLTTLIELLDEQTYYPRPVPHLLADHNMGPAKWARVCVDRLSRNDTAFALAHRGWACDGRFVTQIDAMRRPSKWRAAMNALEDEQEAPSTSHGRKLAESMLGATIVDRLTLTCKLKTVPVAANCDTVLLRGDDGELRRIAADIWATLTKSLNQPTWYAPPAGDDNTPLQVTDATGDVVAYVMPKRPDKPVEIRTNPAELFERIDNATCTRGKTYSVDERYGDDDTGGRMLVTFQPSGFAITCVKRKRTETFAEWVAEIDQVEIGSDSNPATLARSLRRYAPYFVNSVGAIKSRTFNSHAEILAAVERGVTVHWSNDGYTVKSDGCIYHTGNGSCGGKITNETIDKFFVK